MAKETQSHLLTFQIAPGLLIPILSLFALGVGLAVPQLLGLIAFGLTPGQFVFGYTWIDASGAPAGRARLLLRWGIAWALPIAAFVGATRLAEDRGGSAALLLLLLLAPWAVGLAIAVLCPARGLQDQWAGCWLVPR